MRMQLLKTEALPCRKFPQPCWNTIPPRRPVMRQSKPHSPNEQPLVEIWRATQKSQVQSGERRPILVRPSLAVVRTCLRRAPPDMGTGVAGPPSLAAAEGTVAAGAKHGGCAPQQYAEPRRHRRLPRDRDKRALRLHDRAEPRHLGRPPQLRNPWRDLSGLLRKGSALCMQLRPNQGCRLMSDGMQRKIRSCGPRLGARRQGFDRELPRHHREATFQAKRFRAREEPVE